MSPEEAQAFQEQLAALLAEEAVCPDCWAAARDAEGTMEPSICEAHQYERRRLAFG